MAKPHSSYINYIEYLIMGFIFVILFGQPALFTRIDGSVSWIHVMKIWKDQCLLIPLFMINHWVLVPRLMLRRRYISYFISIFGLVALFTFCYYYYDMVMSAKPDTSALADLNRPSPIPPYAHLLMYSLLILGVDTGLLFTKKWNENEKKRDQLEKKNAEMQLNILRNQISPHFFMNTLNNIYALIDLDTPNAKAAVMKLSKLMRYMLYESENGKVKLSKEFEFINSYIDLMRLRFSEDMVIELILPEKFDEVKIPPMLFLSYIENAFKYGASYENKSFIRISFEWVGNELVFRCVNTIHRHFEAKGEGGLGNLNNENRLRLLFGDKHTLSIHSSENRYEVELKIPVS